jgi:hypothetical protein
MKRIYLIPAMVAALAMTACGGDEEATEDENTESEPETTETVDVARSAIDPFPDFPMASLNANDGDVVLTPSKSWQEDATAEGADNVTFIYYDAVVSTVGEGTSTVDFTFDGEVEIPNYMIIPIKANQSAKKGDIILTWWQSGSGMQRAIVTDDSDPSAPEVCYLDLDWDNPATTSEGVGIGQAKYQLEAGTFHVLTSDWSPGTTVAVSTDGKYKAATIVSINGDDVLTIGFAGKMKMYSKADCTPCPVVPNVNVGDEIQAPWVGSFTNSVVEKVDKENGRIWCDDPYSDEPMVIAFGDVLTGLAL